MPLLPHFPRLTLAGVGALICLTAVAACGGDSSTEPAGDDVTLELTIVAPAAVPLSIHVRETVALTATVARSDGLPVVGVPIVQWMSRNPVVASVTATGLVRGSEVGESYIVAEMSTSMGVVRDSVRVLVSPAETPQ